MKNLIYFIFLIIFTEDYVLFLPFLCCRRFSLFKSGIKSLHLLFRCPGSLRVDMLSLEILKNLSTSILVTCSSPLTNRLDLSGFSDLLTSCCIYFYFANYFFLLFASNICLVFMFLSFFSRWFLDYLQPFKLDLYDHLL